MDEIGLLLEYADSHRPVLGEPLGWETAAKAPKPSDRTEGEEPGVPDFRADGADPNDIHLQRWGVVVPDDDKVASRLLSLIDPLVKLRKEQQGAEPIIYKAPKGMGPEEASRWWSEVYQDEEVHEADRPRYLAILGDADLISWDFQQRLALDVFIGRLAFQDDDGYSAYANKVVKDEQRRATSAARALFYTVRDGTQATSAGHAGLMVPTLKAAREGDARGEFNASEITLLGEETGNVDLGEFRAAVAEPAPTMMFSISHGLGAPRKGWGSVEEQRRFQGALSFGGGQRLTHEDVAKGPFLPGGVWFYFACLGAGTPGTSAYHHWLGELKKVGLFAGPLDDVLRSLPTGEQAPFVARLPQAALANPEGPLSVLGHVDLAWTFSFQEYILKDGKKVAKNRPSRFQDIFRQLVEGKRGGAGYKALQRLLSNASFDLTTLYDQEASASAKGLSLPDDPTRKMRKATLWMERQDVSAYVLLGDPAVRLNVDPTMAKTAVGAPIDGAPDRVSAPTAPSLSIASLETAPLPAPEAPAQAPAPQAAPPSSAVKKLDTSTMEAALLRVLSEEETAKKAAERLGVDKEDVTAWAAAYQAAGRKALTEL